MPRPCLTGVLVLTGLLSASFACAQQGTPKYIVLMIGDGCGYGHIEAASLYAHGVTGAEAYDRFPVKIAMSTYSLGGGGYDPEKAWSEPAYIRSGATDSGAGATAMACGIKTYDGAIGVGPDRLARTSILERAEELGMASGVVTSVPFSHATPAAFVAHNTSRGNYVQIATEMIGRSACEVIMGAGHPFFDSNGVFRAVPPTEDREKAFAYVGGRATWDALVAGAIGADADQDGVADPWRLVQRLDEFTALASGPAPRRVVGVAQVGSTLQQARTPIADADGDGKISAADAAAEAPFATPLLSAVPSLAVMAQGALSVLGQDPEGFVLMIEGGAIDWAAHSNQSGRVVEEQVAFNEAVAAVVAWIEAHGGWDQTLLIVTADHETGGLWGPGEPPAWCPLVSNGPGKLPTLQWLTKDHTNALVPLFAKGQGCEDLERCATASDPVRGRYLDNTDVARVIFSLLN